MCWPWKKKYKKIKSPIFKKYKKCNNCKNVFNVNHNDYLKCKNNKENIYYCSNNCYIKYVKKGNELFELKF